MSAGSISIENPIDDFQYVLVTIDSFDGSQNVGELFGTVTVKPGTASKSTFSNNLHVLWSDAHVDLMRSP